MKRKKSIPLNEYASMLINASLAEDIGSGDLTTDSIVPLTVKGKATILAKERFVIAGLLFTEKVFRTLDENIKFKRHVNDGDTVNRGDAIASVSGRLANILKAERVALNFLQRLSGVATLTGRFIKEIRGTGVKILDTRKTTPCMRILERYAVRVGGGENHRFGLFDAILIKDNHIKIAGGVEKAIKRVKEKYPKGMSVEVEVKDLKEVKEALKCGAAVIMLDNMDTAMIKKAVSLIGKRALVEVSGGVTLKNVRRIASCGADFISIGALTHSARAVDASLEIEKWNQRPRR